jgi:hypothetical protein
VVTCAEDGAALRAACDAAAARPGGAAPPAPPSDADVRWAASVLLSRAFYLEDMHENADDPDDPDDQADDAEDGEQEDFEDFDEDDDAEFAPNSVLALVPWADRRAAQSQVLAARCVRFPS